MIKVENITTSGWEAALRGMRNPMNSWDKSDTKWGESRGENGLIAYSVPRIGRNDLGLMRSLYQAGTECRKYLRMIHVSMDITAPLYWYKEFDTYKVGVSSNGCSTMHKLFDKKFEVSDFSFDGGSDAISGDKHISRIVRQMNVLRSAYLKADTLREVMTPEQLQNTVEELHCRNLEEMKKAIWRTAVQQLPSAYNQKRTIDMNYENVFNILHQREGHRLTEWNSFVEILKSLPYVKEISRGLAIPKLKKEEKQ